MKLNTLVIGSGGREHAIVRTLALSDSCGKIYCLPGNPGILEIAEQIKIDVSDYFMIAKVCKENCIDLVVIGPEQPLADGMADALRGMGINVFGPSKDAAMLETSKDFAKRIMLEAGVPTATFRTFEQWELRDALEYLQEKSFPLVIKADGLAAGKGVVIAKDLVEATNTIREYLSGKFGQSGMKLLIEEFMYGDEVSIFAICDGIDYYILPPAQDHKKISDGELGKNTGGMGAYAPTPLITNSILDKIETKIIKPMMDYMYKRGTPFVGCLYAGLMITADLEPKVVEFNVRFGDPETQAILNVIDGDFCKLLFSAATGKIDKNAVSYTKDKFAVCLVLASKGYPDSFDKGFKISGIDEAESMAAIVYQAGTKVEKGELLTNGGRVLGVTSCGKNIFDAIQSTYKAAFKIDFENKYYRNDIGIKGIQHLQW